jgi:hypothetical protein
MVNQMVLDSKPRTGPIGGGMSTGVGISPSFDMMYKQTYGMQQPHLPQQNVFNPTQPAEQLATSLFKRESELAE